VHLATVAAVWLIWLDMENSTTSPRRRISAEEHFRFVFLFRESGLTQAAFVRQHGINLHTFQQWIYFRRLRTAKKPRKTFFREVTLSSGLSPSWAAEVSLDSGMSVRLSASAKPKLISFLIQNLRPTC
jgi:transposase-like protein